MLLLLIAVLVQVSGDAVPPASACARALGGGPSVIATEVCQAEAEQKLGVAAPPPSPDRTTHLQAAIDHYEKAANLVRDPSLKKQVLEQWSSLLERPLLERPDALEQVLRELVFLDPADLAPAFRLARFYEDRGFFNTAEDTLIDVRRQQPEALEPYKMLAQFYARRVGALQNPAERPRPVQNGVDAEPDEKGIYRVGGNVSPPRREGTPVYPLDAKAAGIEGVVAVEIVIGVDGAVSEARIVRSIPLLDAAALEAVQKWRYEPTLVNGVPVPVRITAVVNFTTR